MRRCINIKKVFFHRLGDHATISGEVRNGKSINQIKQGEIGEFEDHIAEAYIKEGLCFEVVEGVTEKRIEKELKLHQDRTSKKDNEDQIIKEQIESEG